MTVQAIKGISTKAIWLTILRFVQTSRFNGNGSRSWLVFSRWSPWSAFAFTDELQFLLWMRVLIWRRSLCISLVGVWQVPSALSGNRWILSTFVRSSTDPVTSASYCWWLQMDLQRNSSSWQKSLLKVGELSSTLDEINAIGGYCAARASRRGVSVCVWRY